jgi:membrane protease YdiL (CAAX protease family)
MTNPPEDEAREPLILPESESADFGAAPAYSYAPSISPEPPLFYSYAQPPLRRFVRIPNFGHLLLLSLLIIVAFSILIIVLALASHFHLFGLRLSQKSATDLGFNLASEAILYLVTFGLSLFVFPMVWNESLFAGLQWRGTVALSKFGSLAAIALGCFGLAGLDQILLPGPANSPIEKMISSPGAAWLMFAFGVTMAPFFEEMFFRGFLLPALCTACDWIAEKMRASLPRSLDASGHPQWSLPAMEMSATAATTQR